MTPIDISMPRLIMMGGFPGAGKTAVILPLVEHAKRPGQKAGRVAHEPCDVLLDAQGGVRLSVLSREGS